MSKGMDIADLVLYIQPRGYCMTANRAQPEQPVADLIASECLAVRVRMLNRTITGIYDQALRSLGLTIGQLNILTVVAKRTEGLVRLWDTGDSHEGR